MPSYGWLYKDKTDFAILSRKLAVMKSIGVPYSDSEVRTAEETARAEALAIAGPLIQQGATQDIQDKEIIALIAYLQRLGQDMKKGIIQ